MAASRDQQIEDLFHDALERGPHVLLFADSAIRREVEQLLESYREWSAALPPPSAALPRFGPYQCESILGAGGMGTVYRAHRADGQFQQEVAVKVLRGAFASEGFRERFLNEREILARLNHPGVARLLDGGMTQENQPYLVMELVAGQPMDEYCDARRLDLPSRLALFDQVLDAVDYAHRHLVVHRDIKPGNILVTGGGQAKLLDFGMSKTAEAEDTNTSTRALTPRYASPEQLRAEPVGVASDVYSAAILLFELLTGAHPFGDSSLTRSLEIARGAVSAQPAPSAASEAAALSRGVSLSALRHSLSGDLDVVLRKALEHDPVRRYPSIAQFRADLRCVREGRVVSARPASAGYRAARFVRRHKLPVVLASAAAVAMAAGLIASLWQARIAQRRFAEVRSLARFVVNDWNSELQQLPGSTALQKRSVEKSLEYLDRLAGEAAGDRSLRLELAEGYLRLGNVLGNPFRANLGERGQAEAAYSRGLRILEGLGDAVPVRRLRAELHLQRGGVRSFGGDTESGLVEIRSGVAELKNLSAALPADSSLHLAVALSLEFLARRSAAQGGLIETGFTPAAAALYADATREASIALGTDAARSSALRQLAAIENSQAIQLGSVQPSAALERHRQALAYLDRLPAPEQLNLEVRRLRANILINRGFALGQAGRHAEGIADAQRAGEILEAWLHQDPGNTAARYQLTTVHRTIGLIESYRRRDREAAKAFEAAADLHGQLLQVDPENLNYRYLRSEMLVRAGNSWAAAGDRAGARDRSAEGLRLMAQLAAGPKPNLSAVFGACRWLVETRVAALRDFTRAAHFCRQAKQLTNHSDPDAYAGLAAAEFGIGNRAAAIRELNQAIALLPPAEPGKPVSQQRRDMEAGLRQYQRIP
ncbi:MAG: serine/threonine protein kinase [Bryobacteraceae bacterium]|nr:serine/threonine protein kinase [Bryobacteraceae bacterium]